MAEWQALFTGTDLAGWSGSDAVDHDWEVVGGVALDADDPTRLSIEAGKGLFHNGRAGRTADLVSRISHGDCELHVEFVIPEKSNSGVYVMGLYEIQILDSWGETELKYSTCGGVYCQWIDEKPVGGTPPTLNASRPPGEWQSYDITFRAPAIRSGWAEDSKRLLRTPDVERSGRARKCRGPRPDAGVAPQGGGFGGELDAAGRPRARGVPKRSHTGALINQENLLWP